MRKIVKDRILESRPKPPGPWLNLESLCRVEISSEDPAHPVEDALVAQSGAGWRAASPGEQSIRLLFDEPQDLRRIYLEFEELERERTQEYLIRVSTNGGESSRDILRQQYNFALYGARSEIEDYRVELDGVSVLELRILPHLGGGEAVASLKVLRLA